MAGYSTGLSIYYAPLGRVGRISADAILACIAFVYWVSFENVFFVYSEDIGGPLFFAGVNAFKLGLPVILLAMTGLPPICVVTRNAPGFYVASFTMFLVWALVPTIVSGDMVTWLKFLARYMFFVAALSLWVRRPGAFAVFAKCMIVYTVIAIVQFIVMYASGSYENASLIGNHYLAGPLGLFGNISSRFGAVPGTSVPIIRLAGLWNEPSNASAVAFASYFLGKYLHATGHSPRWRMLSKVCFAAGMLTLSNAGYFALGLGLLTGLAVSIRGFTVRRLVRILVVAPVAATLVFVAFGRSYFAERFAGNIWLLAVTGVRAGAVADYTAGRVDLLNATLESTRDNWIGVGVQSVGVGGIAASASAPVLWLLLTGLPGLLLLTARETSLAIAARRAISLNPERLLLVQALVVVMSQQLSYGSWMDANYLALAAVVLAATRWKHSDANET